MTDLSIGSALEDSRGFRDTEIIIDFWQKTY